MMRPLLLGAVAALVGMAAIYTLYIRDIGKVTASLEGRSQFVDTEFGPIEYAELGEGPPVLVIHGSGGGFQQGLLMAEPLAQRGFRLIAPSRFGYLRTPARDDLTVALQADAHAAFMARLGVEKAVIIGGSAGAQSAMQLAIRHPDACEALVLLVPAAYAPDRRPNESGAESTFAEGFMMAMLKPATGWFSSSAPKRSRTRSGSGSPVIMRRQCSFQNPSEGFENDIQFGEIEDHRAIR